MDAVTALGPERCALAAVPSAALAVLLVAVVANPAVRSPPGPRARSRHGVGECPARHRTT